METLKNKEQNKVEELSAEINKQKDVFSNMKNEIKESIEVENLKEKIRQHLDILIKENTEKVNVNPKWEIIIIQKEAIISNFSYQIQNIQNKEEQENAINNITLKDVANPIYYKTTVWNEEILILLGTDENGIPYIKENAWWYPEYLDSKWKKNNIITGDWNQWETRIRAIEKGNSLFVYYGLYDANYLSSK